MKNIIILISCLSLNLTLSSQNHKSNRIELLFDRTFIGNSIHLLFNNNYNNFHISYGIRYHINTIPKWNEGQAFVRTMYAKNFFQHFGPVLNINFLIPIKNWSAKPFLGYNTQLGVMMRRRVYLSNVGTGNWIPFEEKSPLFRWENQIIIGSYLTINDKTLLKLYGGLGVAGIFNIDPSNIILDSNPNNRRTREFGSQAGLGISYSLH